MLRDSLELEYKRQELQRQRQEFEDLLVTEASPPPRVKRSVKELMRLLHIGGLPQARRSYIYVLIDPRDGLVHYVGVTRHLDMRYNNHLRGREGANRKDTWVEELRALGLQPSLIVLEEVTDGPGVDPFKIETQWIEECLRAGMSLTNKEAGRGQRWA